MGVKYTCALYCLLGIMVHLSVEVTSSRNAGHRTGLRRIISDLSPDGVDSVPLNREKRERVHIVEDDGRGNTWTVKDDGKGNRQESSSFSTGNGHGFASSWSSSFSSGGGGKPGKSGGFGSGHVEVGTRSGFSDSGNSQSHKPGQGQSHGGPPGRKSSPNGPKEKGASQGVPKSSSNSGSPGQNLSPGGPNGGPKGSSNSGLPGQEWTRGNFQDEDWMSYGFPGYYFNRFMPRQFGPNVGSPPNYPNQNSLPHYSPSPNFVDPLEQYFRNVQEQQQRFQAFAQNPYQPGSNSWAHAAASMTSPNGGVQPNARAYTYSWSSTPTRSTDKSNRDAGHSFRQHNQAVENQQRYSGLNNGIDYGSGFNNYYPNPYGVGSRGDFGNDFGNFDNFNQGFPYGPSEGFSNSFSQPEGGNSASASINVGPNGGFRQAEVRPGTPGIESRFAEELPPPSGNHFGSFTSSSSSSYTGPDGKEKHQNSAVIGVNDNGKVSYRTVHSR